MHIGDFLKLLAESLPPEAAKNFGGGKQLSLVRRMRLVGMESYPPLVGDPQGERSGGGAICERCGHEHGDHPLDWRVIEYGDVPYLHVLCDGRRVKL